MFFSGDLAERIGGLPLRHICVVLQGVQLIFTVALALLYGISILRLVPF
jgi:hypothetical protein